MSFSAVCFSADHRYEVVEEKKESDVDDATTPREEEEAFSSSSSTTITAVATTATTKFERELERLTSEAIQNANATGAVAVVSSPSSAEWIAEKYGEVLVFGIVNTKQVYDKAAERFTGEVETQTKVTSAVWLPKNPRSSAAPMAYAFTTNDVGHYDNFNKIKLLVKKLVWHNNAEDMIPDVATEILAFGLGKWGIQLAVLQACIEDTATNLPKSLRNAIQFLESKRDHKKDLPKIDEFNKVIEAIELRGDVEYGRRYLKQIILEHIPMFFNEVKALLAKDATVGKYKNDPIVGILGELELASKFEAKAEDYSVEELQRALDQLQNSRSPFITKNLLNSHPFLSKLLGRTCAYFPLCDAWEQQELSIWFVAYVRYWLLSHSHDSALLTYFILGAFGKKSELSAGFKPTKKFADEIWAHGIQVKEESHGALDGLMIAGDKPQHEENVLKLTIEGEQKLLSKSNDLSLGMLTEQLGCDGFFFTEAQKLKKAEVEALMTRYGIRRFAFTNGFHGDLLCPCPLSDELKYVLRNIDKDTAFKTIRRIHSALSLQRC